MFSRASEHRLLPIIKTLCFVRRIMSVAVFPLGPLETNCYIVSNEGQAVAIDVGGDPAPVSKYLKEHGLELKAICITHMHFDHLYGVAALAAETHATVYTPEKDKVIASTVLGAGRIFRFSC